MVSMHVGRFEGDEDGAGYQGKSAGTRQFPEVGFIGNGPGSRCPIILKGYHLACLRIQTAYPTLESRGPEPIDARFDAGLTAELCYYSW